MVINEHFVNHVKSPERRKNAIAQDLAQVLPTLPTYRNPNKVVTDPNGSPTHVITELTGKTPKHDKTKSKTKNRVAKALNFNNTSITVNSDEEVLTRSAKIGGIYLFSNHPENQIDTPQVERIDDQSDFYQSDAYAAIRKAQEAEKKQSIHINQKLLIATARERAMNGTKRAASQNKLMVEPGVSEKKGSATRYATETKLFPDMRWEWLHLVGHAIAGNKFHHADNLVAGTREANSQMMLFENQMGYLAKQYPEGFNLEVKTILMDGKGVQIGKNIEYSISTKDFTLPITFNAQSVNAVHVNFSLYIECLIKALVTASKDKSKGTAPLATSSQSLFFSKKNVDVPAANVAIVTADNVKKGHANPASQRKPLGDVTNDNTFHSKLKKS